MEEVIYEISSKRTLIIESLLMLLAILLFMYFEKYVMLSLCLIIYIGYLFIFDYREKLSLDSLGMTIVTKNLNLKFQWNFIKKIKLKAKSQGIIYMYIYDVKGNEYIIDLSYSTFSFITIRLVKNIKVLSKRDDIIEHKWYYWFI